MSLPDALGLFAGFLFLLIAGEAAWHVLSGPDPDLDAPWDPAAEAMCRCGARGGARRHIHPSWTERGPR
jgi:hypothetical protein